VLHEQSPQAFSDMIDRFVTYAVPQLRYLSEDDAASAREDVFARIQESIERINAGALGVFGALSLVMVGITLLSAVEYALNDVFGVTQGRSFAQRVVYYWAGVTLGPILILFALGLTGSGVVAEVLGRIPGGFAPAIFWFVLPFAVLGTAFTLLYWTLPNTPVPFRAALWGGLTAGTLFQTNNLLSALYLSQVVGYSKVYGSLGAIPVLMVGLYLSWTIVLLGAEVAQAVATPRTQATDDPPPEGFEGRARLALECARLAAAAYLAGRGGASPIEIAESLGVPLGWVNAAISALRDGGILVAAESAEDRGSVLPARPPEAISALEVLDALRRPPGERPAPPAPSAEITEFFARLHRAEREALEGVTLAALADGCPPPAVEPLRRLRERPQSPSP
jgi:membrane protein